MKIFLIFLFITTTFVHSSEWDKKLNVIIEKLDDDDYSVRCDASNELIEFPGRYAIKFLVISKKYYKKPEVKLRLRLAAKELYLKKIITKTDRYLELFGDLGIITESVWSHDEEKRQNTYVGKEVYKSSVGNKIKKHDIIITVNKYSSSDFFDRYYQVRIIPKKEYIITMRRYTNLKEIIKRGYLRHNDKYKEIEIKIIAGNRPRYDIDHQRIKYLKKEGWRGFLEEVEYKEPISDIIIPMKSSAKKRL